MKTFIYRYPSLFLYRNPHPAPCQGVSIPTENIWFYYRACIPEDAEWHPTKVKRRFRTLKRKQFEAVKGEENLKQMHEKI